MNLKRIKKMDNFQERRTLPEGWEWMELFQLVELIAGQAPPSSSYNQKNDGVPFLRVNSFGEQYPKTNFWTNKPLKICKKGDILLSVAGTIGDVNIADNEYAITRSIFAIRAKNNSLFINYLFYYLKILKEILKDASSGSSQKIITIKTVTKLEIPLPSIETQRRIVSILEKAEETKRLRAQADEFTDRLLQSVFLEMFGDPVRNPKGWEGENLGEVLSENPQNGLYKPSTDYGGGTPILRIDSFYDGKITNIERLKRLKCTQEEIDKFKLQVGDILINRVNSLEYLGKCGLVQNLFEDTVYESNMMRIRPRTNILNSTYLTAFLCTKHIKNQILSRAKKAVNQASINQGDVTSLPILLPPLLLQQEFARVVEKIESMRQSQNQSKQQIEDLFSALMQKAFRGEI